MEFARHEVHLHVRETGMQNRGTRIDDYLRAAGVRQSTMDNDTQHGADDRMWCGMFVHYCYLQAAREAHLSLPFDGSDLWGGRSLNHWALRHSETVMTNQMVQPGDIFALRNNHIGMAISASDEAKNFETVEGNQADLEHPEWESITIRNNEDRRARNRKNVRNQNVCRVIIRI